MGDEFQSWKHHFIQQAKGLIPHQRKFYRVSSMQQLGKGDQPTIKLVSPTEQIVERAKTILKDPPPDPPSVYDPVTGVMQHAQGKHSTISRKRKQQKSKTPHKNSKKRKITASKRIKKRKKTKKMKRKTKKTLKRKTPKKKWWK